MPIKQAALGPVYKCDSVEIYVFPSRTDISSFETMDIKIKQGEKTVYAKEWIQKDLLHKLNTQSLDQIFNLTTLVDIRTAAKIDSDPLLLDYLQNPRNF